MTIMSKENMNAAGGTSLTMETLVSLCKRRGFIYPSSEIYGGINGFFDYGPLGVELRNNIKAAWWRDMVHCRDDVVGLDSSIVLHPKVWEASGHVAGFSDPMVDCKATGARYRADQIFFSAVQVDGETIGYVSVLEGASMEASASDLAQQIKRKLGKRGDIAPLALRDYTEATAEERALIPSPATGIAGGLTPPRDFNLMFQTWVGAVRDEGSVAYLRPETAQGIFVDFKQVVDTSRVKIPFGIAQVGKSFRNEITPRNFIFRSREFEQMELEYFISPYDDWKAIHREWIDACKQWLVSIGIRAELLSEYDHPQEKLAFYSRGTTDIMFAYPFGIQELWGIAARGDYDLRQHQEASGKSMEYFDEERKEKYIPHVVEPALGVDRTMLAVLCAAYAEDEIDGERRTVLRFHPRLAPYKVAVFPLVKNKPELLERANAIHKRLRRRWNTFFDASGAIGRRYRRQDEIGTPFGVTIDFETIEKDGTVTVRDRDSTQQVRVADDQLEAYLAERIERF